MFSGEIIMLWLYIDLEKFLLNIYSFIHLLKPLKL